MCDFGGTDGTDGTDVWGLRAGARACALVYAHARTRTGRGYPLNYPSHPSPTRIPRKVSASCRGHIVYCMCPASVPSVPASRSDARNP